MPIKKSDFIYDIEKRVNEYRNRQSFRQLSADRKRIKIIKRISEDIGEGILTEPQVRVIAYLLGFSDKYYNKYIDGPSGISLTTYRKQIENKIPDDSMISLPNNDTRLRYRNNDIAYRIKGIKTAFVKLYKEGKLEFSSKRFRYSLDRIL